MKLNEKLKIPSAIELFKSLRTIASDWSSKTPYQKWCYFYATGKIMSKPIGVPLFEENQTIHWYSYTQYTISGAYFVFGAYTAYYYAIRGELEKWLPCTCLCGITLSVAPFVWATLSKNRDKYHSLITFAGHYIYPDNHDRTEHNRICSEQMDLTMKGFIKRIMIIMLAAYCAVAGPIYVYFVDGTKTTTVELKFPFVEENSNIEYALNMLFQFTIIIYGGFVYWSMEEAMAIFGDVIKVTPKLIKHRLNELLEMYKGNEISELQLRVTFTDITKQLTDYENFVADVRDFLYGRNLITPILFTSSIAIAIFCQFTMGFVAGYGIAVMSWVQFYFICETGQNVEDNKLDEILYDNNWYDLPCELQKDVMHLINQRQNRITLNVGPFAIVNRDLLAVVTNKIYGFIMFLLNIYS